MFARQINGPVLERLFVLRCAIWYHLYHGGVLLSHGGVLLLKKLQGKSLQFTEIDTPPWVFFTFFELYKWYQIAQNITSEFNINT